jgi:hypothetical protein
VSKPLGFGDPPVLSEGDESSSTGLRGNLNGVELNDLIRNGKYVRLRARK